MPITESRLKKKFRVHTKTRIVKRALEQPRRLDFSGKGEDKQDLAPASPLRRRQKKAPISFFLENFETTPDFRAMLFQPSESRPRSSPRVQLSELEIEAIEMFINFLRIIGLQKSIGEIYGLLFVSAKPLSMDDIMNRLDISLGAASQGLKLLRSVGAVKAIYSPGVRRDHFAADLELSKFATVFIKEELRPRVERALERIQHMESLLAEMPANERQATMQRLVRLRHWLEKGEKMLPWALKFLVK
jgi:HTH-type transcriptional regulator, glycine betaine synthesis regulator